MWTACSQSGEPVAAGLWTLSLPDRRAALRRLATRDKMQQALQADADRPEVPLQRMFESVLAGPEPVDFRDMPREDLVGLIKVRDWVEEYCRTCRTRRRSAGRWLGRICSRRCTG